MIGYFESSASTSKGKGIYFRLWYDLNNVSDYLHSDGWLEYGITSHHFRSPFLVF